jgi:uncharacterized protein
MRALNIIALILVIVGAVNWGLVGLVDFNLVSAIFGADTALSNIIYLLVGIAGIYCIYLIKVVMDTPHRPVVKRT